MPDELLEALIAAQDPAAKAAIVAEVVFDTLPEPLAELARGCVVLNWFDRDILAAITPDDGSLSADFVYQQLQDLPFVESVPWGLAYHDLTRSGLLARYAQSRPTLLVETAQKAAPAYAARSQDEISLAEAFYCYTVAGQHQQALAMFERFLLHAPDGSDWRYFASILRLKEQAEALAFVQPLSHPAWQQVIWGLVRADQGDLAGAIADYDQAIALDPQFALAYTARGTARSDQGDLAGAIADFNQAIALDPQYATAYRNRGNARRAQGDPAGAIADYDQAIALNPQDAAVYRSRGRARQAQGDLAGAIADFNQAIALNPQDAAAYRNRGRARQAQDDLAGAIADYDQAIALDPQFAVVYTARGTARSHQGDLAGAIADYDQAIALDPQFVLAYTARGTARRAQGDLAGAIADYDQAAALFSEDVETKNSRGIARSEEYLARTIMAFLLFVGVDPNDNQQFNKRLRLTCLVALLGIIIPPALFVFLLVQFLRKGLRSPMSGQVTILWIIGIALTLLASLLWAGILLSLFRG